MIHCLLSNMNKISKNINPDTLPSILKVFWALDYLESEDNDRFSVKEITDCIVEKGETDISRQLVQINLNKSKGNVNKNTKGYKLMDKGKNELTKFDAEREKLKNMETILIEPGKPFTTKHEIIKDILKDQVGEIRICDPYVDFATLSFVHQNFSNKNPIKILTTTINDKPQGTIAQGLKDLKTEGFNIEIRIYTSSILHDRYIIDDKHLWVSGNSFNGIGTKESFISKMSEDFRQSMLSTYNSRFKSATLFI